MCSRRSVWQAEGHVIVIVIDDEHHMIFDCERFEALRNEAAEFVPGTRRYTPGVRTTLNRAGGSVRRFMESDPHTVLKFVSKCMDIVETEAHAD